MPGVVYRCAADSELTGCHTVNLACGRSKSILDLLDALRGIAGVDVEPTWAPARVGDVKHSLADITRARELLGFEPSVSFEEGLERTFAWYRRSES